MADTPISGLTALTAKTLADGDKFAIDDVSAAATRSTLASDIRFLVNSSQGMYSVKDYAATGDGQKVTDGAMTSASTTLTSASGLFTAADVGKTIGVSAAGGAALATAGAPTVALSAGYELAVGAFKYKITFVNAQGETPGGTESAAATTTAGNQRVSLSAIPTGGAGTIARGIYRTAVGGANGSEALVGFLGDNTTTVYVDTLPDYFLGAAVPTVDTSAAPLITTISTFTNTTTVVLAAAANHTVASSIVTWGTDDTTAIHAARDAAGVNGIVFFPPGVYTSPKLTANVVGQVWLLDRGATIRLKAGTDSQVIDESGANGWQLVGGTIDGNKDNIASMTLPLIRLNDSQSTLGARIYGVEITNAHDASAQGAIMTTRDYTVIQSCNFHDNNQTGVHIQTKLSPVSQTGTSHVTIQDNTFKHHRYVAVAVTGDLGRLTLNTTLASGDLTVVSTTAIPTSWPQIGTINIESEVIRYTSYTASTFTVPASNGRGYAGTTAVAHTAPTNISIGVPWEGARVRGTHITDNDFIDCGWINNNGEVGAIEVWYSNFYTSILNNYIEDCRSFVAMSVVGCFYASIKGNTVVGPIVPVLGATQWALELGNGKHYTVAMNNFDMRSDTFQQAGPTAGTLLTFTRGIVWSGQATDLNRDNSLTGNTITNAETGMSPAWGFGNSISGNGFYNIYTWGIGYDSGQAAQDSIGDEITSNVFRNPNASAPQGIAIECGNTASHGAQQLNAVGNNISNFSTGIHTGNSGNDTINFKQNNLSGVTTAISGTAGNVIASGNTPPAANTDQFKLTAQHSISSVTATEVTGLRAATLSPGTYLYTYTLIVRSATSTVGVMLGINFTGTGSPRHHFRFADATTVITAEVHSMDDQGIQGAGFISGMADSTKSTTTPAMGTTVGVATINTDILCFIEGIIVVTAVGDLALWHGSETATATSVEVGSSLSLVRTS